MQESQAVIGQKKIKMYATTWCGDCRMTLSFSKSVVMQEAGLLLFLHRYNRDRAILLT